MSVLPGPGMETRMTPSRKVGGPQVTHSEESHICPRCRFVVVIWAGGKIRPHRDPLTEESCPVRGMSFAEAAEWIHAERVKVGLESE